MSNSPAYLKKTYEKISQQIHNIEKREESLKNFYYLIELLEVVKFLKHSSLNRPKEKRLFHLGTAKGYSGLEKMQQEFQDTPESELFINRKKIGTGKHLLFLIDEHFKELFSDIVKSNILGHIQITLHPTCSIITMQDVKYQYFLNINNKYSSSLDVGNQIWIEKLEKEIDVVYWHFLSQSDGKSDSTRPGTYNPLPPS